MLCLFFLEKRCFHQNQGSTLIPESKKTSNRYVFKNTGTVFLELRLNLKPNLPSIWIVMKNLLTHRFLVKNKPLQGMAPTPLGDAL